METTTFKIECDHHLSGLHEPDPDEEADSNIIILDDDDFLQTTFNLLNRNASLTNNTNSNNNTSDNKHQSSTFINMAASSPNERASSSSSSSTNILIDLTCDDFDLNDLFLLDTNNSFNLSLDTPKDTETTMAPPPPPPPPPPHPAPPEHAIKNEFDFKVFNFNIKDFTSCIEEILIDDDDEDEDENEHECEMRDDLLATSIMQQTAAEIPAGNSFLNYRCNETASSDHNNSSVANSETHPGNGRMSSNSRGHTVYTCDHCSKTFNKSYNFKRHLFAHKSSHDSALFTVNECPNCRRRIMDKSNFAKHVRLCNQKVSSKKVKYFSYPNSLASEKFCVDRDDESSTRKANTTRYIITDHCFKFIKTTSFSFKSVKMHNFIGKFWVKRTNSTFACKFGPKIPKIKRLPNFFKRPLITQLNIHRPAKNKFFFK